MFKPQQFAVRSILVLAIVLISAPAMASGSDIAVITSISTTLEAIDDEQVRQLWLGKTERIDGTKFLIADRVHDELLDDFYRRVLGKTRGQVKAMRSIRAFQNGIAPPPELPHDESIKTWIRSKPNRLGYVVAEPNLEAGPDPVKVLLILRAKDAEKEEEGSERP